MSYTPLAKQKRFKYWVQMVLPTVYDDSLSYMELLNKVVKYLNEVVDGLNILAENIEFLKDYIDDIYNYLKTELKNYVYQYLDEHPEIVVKDGSITTEKLADGAVTKIKLGSDIIDELYFTMLKNDPDYAVNNVNTFGNLAVIHSNTVAGIVDCGYDPEARALIDYITSKNITKLDFIVITHYHQDHITTNFTNFIESLANVLDLTDCTAYLPHKNISWSNAGIETDSVIYQDYLSVLAALEDNNITIVEPNNREVVELNATTSLKFLNIGSQYYQQYYTWKMQRDGSDGENCDYNSFSMLVELKHQNNVFLITGDATFITQKLNYPNISQCDVYQIEHHGLNVIVNNDWLGVLHPKYALIGNYSDGYNNFNNFHTTAADLASKGASMLNTLDGEINLLSDITGINNLNIASNNKLPSIQDLNYYGAKILKAELFEDIYKTDGKIDLDKFVLIGEFYTNYAALTPDNIYQSKIKGIDLTSSYIKVANELINYNPITIKQNLELTYPASSITLTRYIAVKTPWVDGQITYQIEPRAWYSYGTLNIPISEFCDVNDGFTIIDNQSQVTRFGDLIVARLLIQSTLDYATTRKPLTIKEDYKPTTLINTGCFIGGQFTVTNPGFAYLRTADGVLDILNSDSTDTYKYAKVLLVYKTY